MPYGIRVTNLENNSYWERALTRDEFRDVKQHVADAGESTSDPLYRVLRATIKPIRTNILRNFAKDFFLPTVVNQACTIKDLVSKIFAILGALLLDVPTFPIRLITAIPRVIMNPKKEENSLYRYLLSEGVDTSLLTSNSVYVTLESEHIDRLNRLNQSLVRDNIYFTEVPLYNWREGGYSVEYNPL